MTTNNSPDSTLKIGAKELGALMMPTFCPRCFWYKLHAGRPPFSAFPSIFNEIDLYTKRFVEAIMNETGRPPKWMETVFPGAVRYHNPGFIEWIDEDHNVRLRGAPDVVVHDKDELKWFVGDYKTARYSKGQDFYLLQYRVQLSVYVFLLEKNGVVRPGKAALFYFGPPKQATAKELLKRAEKNGFALPFDVEVVEIEIYDSQVILDLLARVREIYDGDVPEGREGCGDCKKLDNYIAKSKGDPRALRHIDGVNHVFDTRTGKFKVIPHWVWVYDVVTDDPDCDDWFPGWLGE